MNDFANVNVTGSRKFGLTSDGFTHIAVAGVLFVVLAVAGGWLGALVGAALLAFTLNFFRDPERTAPADPSAIVSPADGRVIKVAPVQDDRFLHGQAQLISIFMSPLDVHVNRIPCSGRVVDVRYHAGRYLRAFADKASLDNEQTAVVIEDPQGRRLCFVQIAGFVARRIVCRLQSGMTVQRGQRYGMIKFGSRADIYLPADAEITVKLGDRTTGAETVIARWR